MTSFIRTNAAFTQRGAKNAMALEIAPAFSVARSLLATETSSCVLPSAGPHTGHKHLKSANVAACRLGLSRTFRGGSVHTSAKPKRKQRDGSENLLPPQRQGAHIGKSHMQLTRVDWPDRTIASNAGLREKQKAHILTTNDLLTSGGCVGHAMCVGMQKSRKAAVFRSQYDFTGQQAILESTGQTYEELKAERQAA